MCFVEELLMNLSVLSFYFILKHPYKESHTTRNLLIGLGMHWDEKALKLKANMIAFGKYTTPPITQ